MDDVRMRPQITSSISRTSSMSRNLSLFLLKRKNICSTGSESVRSFRNAGVAADSSELSCERGRGSSFGGPGTMSSSGGPGGISSSGGPGGISSSGGPGGTLSTQETFVLTRRDPKGSADYY